MGLLIIKRSFILRAREGLNDVVSIRSNDFKTKCEISGIHPVFLSQLNTHLLSVIGAGGEERLSVNV